MKIQFYPYDFEYKIKDSKIYVYLYARLEDGSKVCVMHQHQPYFFAAVNNLSKNNLVEFQGRLTSLKVQTKNEPAKVVSIQEVDKELIGKKKLIEYKLNKNYENCISRCCRKL